MADRLYKEYDPEVLHKLQKVELEVLIEFDRICKEIKVPYVLQFGALLGAVRHKGFIPWDDDIDVGMLRDDYNRFVAYCNAHMDSKYAYVDPIVKNDFTKYLPYFYKKGTVFASDNIGWKQGIGIDIFVYDSIPEDNRKQKQLCNRANIVRRLYYLYYRDPVIPFEGIKYYGTKIICKMAQKVIRLISNPQSLYRRFEKDNQKYNQIIPESEWITTFFSSDPYKVRMKRSQFKTTNVLFEGQLISAPSDVHNLLKQVYGDYMKLPPVEKRVNHSPEYIEFGEEE